MTSRAQLTAMFALCALALTGCGTPEKIESKAVAGKVIGIVSVAGQLFSRQYIGQTVFGNEREELDIASWRLDAEFEKGLADAFVARGHAVVLQPHSGFGRIYDRGTRNWEATASAVKSYCKANKVDFVAVLYGSGSPDAFGNSNEMLSGAGTYFRSTLFYTFSYVHLFAEVALVDCVTAQPIVLRRLLTATPGNHPLPTAAPWREIPRELAIAPLNSLSDQQIETLKQALKETTAKAFAPTLDYLLSGQPPKPEPKKKVIQR